MMNKEQKDFLLRREQEAWIEYQKETGEWIIAKDGAPSADIDLAAMRMRQARAVWSEVTLILELLTSLEEK
jgi:uncharacterized protein YecT (DUF1311 family)